MVLGTRIFYIALEQQADLEEGEADAVEPILAVQAMKAVQVVMGLGMLVAIPLEQAGAVLGRQGLLLIRVLQEMGGTGISCLLLQLCPHGSLEEVPAR